MIEDIKMKLVILQQALRQDERLVKSIRNDNELMLDYVDDLDGYPEIVSNYEEPFMKVMENMDKINRFVEQL